MEWRLTKCHWRQPKVVYVGFEISAEGRKPDPSKVEALKNWPKEKELADLNNMFHFANYLREFIPGFIDIVQPLKAYRKKGLNGRITSRINRPKKLRRSGVMRSRRTRR